jgi:hypothetical protein
MSIQELILLGKEISKVLQQSNREELIKPLAKFINDYEELKDEVATFVHGEVESESVSTDEELPELEDEDIVVKIDKGFHSIK